MKKFPSSLLKALAFICIIFFLDSCRNEPVPTTPLKQVKEYNSSIIQEWNNKFLEIERYAPGFRPGPAPRAAAYIGLACYEACIKGMPEYQSVKGNYAGLQLTEPDANFEYHYPTVINAVYGTLMNKFFSSVGTTAYSSKLLDVYTFQSNNYAKFKAEVPADVFEKSKELGEKIAVEMFDYAKTDAIAHDHNLDPFKDGTGKYKLPVGAGFWVPTAPGPLKPMFPDWGSARRFAISESDELCKAPIPYSESKTSQFYTQGLEVYNTVKSATPDQRAYGFFWSDDLVNLTFSPGPRWVAIATQAMKKINAPLDVAVYANAKNGMAINDAAVACWYSKFYYNIERPESYIKRVIDPTWEPLLYNPLTGDKGITPGFPAYPSGHSTMGGASAVVLGDIFGYSFDLTDRCHEGRNDFEGSAPRSYSSFKDMADENAISRIPLGVHFRMDCEVGVALGELCGRRVNQLKWKK
jgi:membrane-associated phospholipid phosphatase